MGMASEWDKFRPIAVNTISVLGRVDGLPKTPEDMRAFITKLMRFTYYAGFHSACGALEKAGDTTEAEQNELCDELNTERQAWRDEVMRGVFPS